MKKNNREKMDLKTLRKDREKLDFSTEDIILNEFPGFDQAFAFVNRNFNKTDPSVNQESWLMYEYLKTWYDRNR